MLKKACARKNRTSEQKNRRKMRKTGKMGKKPGRSATFKCKN